MKFCERRHIEDIGRQLKIFVRENTKKRQHFKMTELFLRLGWEPNDSIRAFRTRTYKILHS